MITIRSATFFSETRRPQTQESSIFPPNHASHPTPTHRDNSLILRMRKMVQALQADTSGILGRGACHMYTYLLGCLLALFAMSCGDVGTSSGNPSVPSTTTLLSTAVASDVVIASPTASTSSTSSDVSVSKSFKAAVSGTGDPTENFQTKRDFLQTLIAGNGADCSFHLDFTEPPRPACYGPRLAYSGHPEATGIDASRASGFLPQGDLGMWNATGADGETACAAAEVNYLMALVSQQVDRSVILFGAMACSGKKAGLTLPQNVGDTLDVTSAMNQNIGLTALTITSAVIERLSDASDGHPTYQSTVQSTLTLLDNSTRTLVQVLRHTPTNDDNTTYHGQMAFLQHAPAGVGGATQVCNNAGQSGVTLATVISYSKTGETAVRQQIKHAEYCGTTTNPLDSDLDIRGDDILDVASGNLDGWADNWNYALFNIDPTTNTGSIAYAWQAGAQDGYSRVLNVDVSPNSDGSASGDAFFGYGPAASDVNNAAHLTGFFCNWAGPNSRGIFQSRAQRQVLVRAATGTKFTPQTSLIRYAPTNSCDASANDGFTFGAVTNDLVGPTPLVMDNNRPSDASILTNELVPLSSVAITLPDAP